MILDNSIQGLGDGKHLKMGLATDYPLPTCTDQTRISRVPHRPIDNPSTVMVLSPWERCYYCLQISHFITLELP